MAKVPQRGQPIVIGYYIDLALHGLRRNKVLTALMILAIAVGIGASMTTLTIMHLLAGDPLRGRSGQIFYPQVEPDPGSPSGRAGWGERFDNSTPLVIAKASKLIGYHFGFECTCGRRLDESQIAATRTLDPGDRA